jgi:hypothetical protein
MEEIHLFVNAKMKLVGTAPGIRGGRMKESSEGVNSSIIYLMHYKNTLVPSYYCLYSLYNKIRDKGKIVSAGY